MPDYVASMVRRTAPPHCGVLEGSTPVVAFGDPTSARVATLGINPSRQEFTDRSGRWLRGDNRRLATLESLGADSCDELDHTQVATVIDECATYFDRNPYGWFNALDRVLRDGAGVTYHDGTACHLDLVQWATDPLWGRLDPRAKRTLLDDGVPHLEAQLDTEHVQVVVFNGAQARKQIEAVDLVDLDEVDRVPFGHMTYRLYEGIGTGIRWFGWSANLQEFRGNRRDLGNDLARWLREAISR